MNPPLWVWFVTVGVLLAIFAVDLLMVDHRPHEISTGEAARWVGVYVTMAVAYGVGLALTTSGEYAKQFFAGYITEYSLSVDNLFVFIVIIAAFRVPAIHEHKVLLFGILTALVLRGVFIAAGAAVISRFQWVFYIFGAFLVLTAIRLASQSGDETDEYRENALLRAMRRVVPVTPGYHGSKTVVRINGKRFVTPMLVVMIALGTTDLLFALDSIPAIFGLTREPLLVFTSNAFALLGLRQLYFMVGGLLARLVYLNLGLALVLGFIGIKLILEALASSGVGWAPHIGIELSLCIVAGVLALTTVASLIKVRIDPSAIRALPGGAPTGDAQRS